jgi:hypothetical protein
MALTYISDRVERALARLPQQHKDKANIRALVSALVGPAQAIEDAIWQLYTLRRVDTAEGVQLDLLGDVVGQPRDGLSDDDYRRYIRARIATNRSLGVVEDLIKITRLVVGDDALRVEVERQNIATIVVRLLEIPITDELADIVFDFLFKAKAAGVRLILESSEEPVADWLVLDEGALDSKKLIDARS